MATESGSKKRKHSSASRKNTNFLDRLEETSKNWMHQLMILLLYGVVLIMAAGGHKGYENPVKVPFDSDECVGMVYNDAFLQLEEAGFINIHEVQTETTNASEDGRVISITIDGKSDYREASVWEDTVPVEIDYYVLKHFSDAGYTPVSEEP